MTPIRIRQLPAAALCLAAAGCDNLLDVNNPNSVLSEDLDNPAAAAAIANGALATVAQAYSWMLLDNASATDELKWVGSRDAYGELNRGNVTDPGNEFTDATWPLVSEARYMADQAILRLKAFRDAGTLPSNLDLARSYLYGGLIYTAVADHYDDFVISDRRDAAPPIGPTAMTQMYDKAIGYLNDGLPLAAANADLERAILAARARARFQKALWTKVNPAGTIAANPLVNDAGAEADALAFLAKTSDPAWRYRFSYSASTVTSNIGFWVNERLEQRIGDPYVTPTADDKKVASVRMNDLIDNRVHPFLQATITEFVGGRQFTPHTVLSAREVRLILAEGALARNDLAAMATHINAIRTADGLTAWVPGGPGMPTGEAMLRFMRRTNLFLQLSRRLTDHYRFRETSQYWLPASEAIRTPGSYFPIARQERESNCHILGSC